MTLHFAHSECVPFVESIAIRTAFNVSSTLTHYTSHTAFASHCRLRRN